MNGALTAREAEILELLVDGHTQLAIAQRLGIDSNTVHTHTVRARKKLGAATTVQAAVIFAKGRGA